MEGLGAENGGEEAIVDSDGVRVGADGLGRTGGEGKLSWFGG